MAAASRTSTAEAESGQVPFERLYDEYFDFVYRNARRLGVPPSAADDVVQEVFVVVHRRLPEYDARSPMPGWIYGILANTVRSFRRSFRRKQAPLVNAQRDDDGTLAANGPSPEAAAQHLRDAATLLRLLDELPEAQRELIVLADLEQMSVPEICQCLGGNVNTVYSRLRVAREALKAKLTFHLLEWRSRP